MVDEASVKDVLCDCREVNRHSSLKKIAQHLMLKGLVASSLVMWFLVVVSDDNEIGHQTLFCHAHIFIYSFVTLKQHIECTN